jgi:hypothetical protein
MVQCHLTVRIPFLREYPEDEEARVNILSKNGKHG